MALTIERRRRLYLETHRDASYTHLPKEHREAREHILHQLEREQPGVRREALAGAPRHFDEPLDKSLESHRAHLRRQDGMQQRDIEQLRHEMDGEEKKPRASQPEPGRRERAITRVRSAPAAARESGALALSWGQFAYKLLGWGIGLSVLYLILTSTQRAAPGKSAPEQFFAGITTLLRSLASPYQDPLSPAASQSLAAASARAAGTGIPAAHAATRRAGQASGALARAGRGAASGVNVTPSTSGA